MKVLLTTLNSKYVHSNLALRYLREVCPAEDAVLREYTINDQLDLVAGEIFKVKADVIGFSCYIWNITPTLELINLLGQVSPETVIVLGGPEVSYDPEEYLAQNPGVDFVVYGEGEETFKELIDYLKSETESVRKHYRQNQNSLAKIPGLAYRGESGPVVNPPRELISDLAKIPSPYRELDGLQHKIAYIESTRGCPFNCQYCLSSTFKGVRYFPFGRTKAELEKLIAAGVKQVKFVDRTFNCSKQHAMEIWRFLAQWNPPANFHFEISADLLDQEMIEFLHTVPPGLFQFEVGVQSTNPHTLELIDRRTDLAKLAGNVQALKAGGNIPQFLDLIAGLPCEDYRSFANSFNEVYSWAPEKIQLGFLKLLKGSGIRDRAEEWGYKFTSSPPYRVLANNWISYGELLKLQVIEDLVDKYYNSGRFKNSLEFLAKNFDQNPFAFFARFAEFWERKGYHRQAHKTKLLYDLLLEFYEQTDLPEMPVFRELLKLDYLLWEKPLNQPQWFSHRDLPFLQQRIESFFREGLIKLIPQLRGASRREIHKYFHLEPFDGVIMPYLDGEILGDGEDLIYLLFYYPGPLIKAERPGFIPVVI